MPQTSPQIAKAVLYGGTFDPPHFGHLAVANAALEFTQSQSLHWVVGGHPPHKPPPRASAAHRLAMVEAMIAHEPRFQLATWELERQGPSYAVDTLRQARKALHLPPLPGALLWVLGADALAGLAAWHQAKTLPTLTDFLVVAREGFNEMALLEQLAHDAPWLSPQQLHFLAMPLVPASSSTLRKALAAGQSSEWLPPSVADCIDRLGLYRAAIPSGPGAIP